MKNKTHLLTNKPLHQTMRPLSRMPLTLKWTQESVWTPLSSHLARKGALESGKPFRIVTQEDCLADCAMLMLTSVIQSVL